MKEQIDIIVKKQCEFVGADFEKIDYHKDDWYMEYEWTKQIEDEFCDWLANHLRNNKKARIALMKRNTRSMSSCIMAATEWVLQYGWKTSTNE